MSCCRWLDILNGFTPDSVVVKDTVFQLFAVVLFVLTIGTAIVSFVLFHKAVWVVFSGAFGVAVALTDVVGVETLEGHVSAQGMYPEYASLVQPGYGVYLALVTGFVFLAAYIVVRQVVSTWSVQAPASVMYCRNVELRYHATQSSARNAVPLKHGL